MAVSRMSVLTGTVIGSALRTIVAVVIIFAVALLLGFRTSAGPVQWLESLGLIVPATLAPTDIRMMPGVMSVSSVLTPKWRHQVKWSSEGRGA
jgi:ABC-2 type transport system permease protein